MTKLVIPLRILQRILANAHERQLNPYLIMGIIWQESGWKWNICGDWNSGAPDRFPADPYWTPNEDNLYPHSFGLMQLHVDGAGGGHTPSELVDINNNINWGCAYLSRCLEAFDQSYRHAISAYNQGIWGTQTRGPDFNKAYVDIVLQLTEELRGATIRQYPGKRGQWKVFVNRS